MALAQLTRIVEEYVALLAAASAAAPIVPAPLIVLVKTRSVLSWAALLTDLRALLADLGTPLSCFITRHRVCVRENAPFSGHLTLEIHSATSGWIRAPAA